MSGPARTTVYRAGNLRSGGTSSRQRKPRGVTPAPRASDDGSRTTSSRIVKGLLYFALAFLLASGGGLYYLSREASNPSLHDLEGALSRSGGDDRREHTTHIVAHLPSCARPRSPTITACCTRTGTTFQMRKERRPLRNNSAASIPGIGYRALPMRERLGKAQIPVIWQMPPPPAQIRGAVLLFHGCGRRAMSFFYSPEGRAIVESILRANMLVAAFTKRADADGCWLQRGEDELRDVEDAAQAWIARLKVIPGWEERTRELRKGKEELTVVERRAAGGNPGAKSSISKDGSADSNKDRDILPVFAFGASSGGHFVARLASRENRLRLQAINVQVAAPVSTRLPDWHVPTFFSVMSRDWTTKERVRAISAGLKAKGVATRVLETETKKIDRAFFARVFDGKKGKGSVGDDWDAIAADENARAREARRRSGRRGRRKGDRVTGGSLPAVQRNSRMQGGDGGALASRGIAGPRTSAVPGLGRASCGGVSE